MKTPPHVALIVVNWNGRHCLERSLPSLLDLDYPDFSLVVVDNASTDDSVDFVRRNYPQVTVLASEENGGFAAGCNLGLRRSDAEFAVVLNPDIQVGRNWLSHLVGPMLEEPAIGIAGCKMYYPGNERRLQHAGGYIEYPRAVPGHIGLGEKDTGQYATQRDVTYVMGASLAIRRSAFAQIGPFDEGFFLYYEDVDLCFRARRAGYRVTYMPAAALIHEESALTVKGSAAYLERMQAGRWRFLLKHYDLDDVLQDTVPAERAWLEQCSDDERAAAASAYRTIFKSLPDIWAARARDLAGSPDATVTDEQNNRMRAALGSLRSAAWQALAREAAAHPPPAQMAPALMSAVLQRLQTRWRIEERPFVSHVPIAGRLIAGIRETWNRVATKWYVRLLLEQQNEFNMLVVQQLNAHEDLLREPELYQRLRDAWLIDQDREQSELARQIAELSAELIQLRRQLDELAGHGAQTVDGPGAEPPE